MQTIIQLPTTLNEKILNSSTATGADFFRKIDRYDILYESFQIIRREAVKTLEFEFCSKDEYIEFEDFFMGDLELGANLLRVNRLRNEDNEYQDVVLDFFGTVDVSVVANKYKVKLSFVIKQTII